MEVRIYLHFVALFYIQCTTNGQQKIVNLSFVLFAFGKEQKTA